MSHVMPFQLLEINIISAQDLSPVSRAMSTYAVAWVHPERKLSTRVDPHGHANPTWNDKFVFRVDEDFLRSDTSAVMINIYAVRFFRDVRVGTVRVLIGNLIPPSTRPRNPHPGMRFVALQVRRPSGRPQGILNLGVTLLDSSMRSMPLYTQLSSSAVGYRDLMGEESNDPHHHHHHHLLRRSKSEHRESINDEVSKKPGSILSGSELGRLPIPKFVGTTGSVWSESELGPAPSVVAAAVAEEYFPDDEMGSSILEDWSMNNSVEGLKSKLERWRTELPPIFDRGGEFGSFPSHVGHVRRHTDGDGDGGGGGGGGLFSCFANACGCECSIICGTNNNPSKKKIGRGKVPLSASDGNLSRSFAIP
ncbi:hypothetical protein HHK36_012937 [Tetracentron sinense]|uniref:C2 domain-containing protein n=1 Tax=Tetracentron sinense TaxID=13715 RepID=A0A835DG52_TETSI|nr:hypothetical protein HHK36_012937 [Tetracentron sinense]